MVRIALGHSAATFEEALQRYDERSRLLTGR